ncbi:66723270-2f82-4e4f-8f61-1642536995f8 [Sclerotinia trifoliorum]|uniref:66723270-2f82-4e4f-8f61-1642536995f8 n=1 Tax=Sclerotinia trifoliorum TaxID=28548 RepID=A0A8H2VTV2_9HELO|nr:66723270-2f82-4e4f-8f61-1642536995f8 [Sclerotinia trifoliorum]
MTLIPLHLEFLDDDSPWDIGVHLFNVFNNLVQPSASQISPREAAEKINMLHPDNEKEDGSGLGPATIEEWSHYDVRAITVRKDQNEKLFKFRNLSSFLARLAKAGFEDSNMLYALTALQNALEYEFEASDASHVLSSDYLVPIAAGWIIKAGELMPLNGGNMGGYASLGGPLWKGEPKLLLERWHFWMRRFEVFGDCEALMEETRNMAKEAVEKMKCIEEQKSKIKDNQTVSVMDN